MIDGLWYGIVASLSFIGFVSILIYLLLLNYSPGKHGTIIIDLPEDLSESELIDTVYGIYLRKVLFADASTGNIIILCRKSDVVSFCDLCGITEMHGSFECLTYEELLDKLKQED